MKHKFVTLYVPNLQIVLIPGKPVTICEIYMGETNKFRLLSYGIS